MWQYSISRSATTLMIMRRNDYYRRKPSVGWANIVDWSAYASGKKTSYQMVVQIRYATVTEICINRCDLRIRLNERNWYYEYNQIYRTIRPCPLPSTRCKVKAIIATQNNSDCFVESHLRKEKQAQTTICPRSVATAGTLAAKSHMG